MDKAELIKNTFEYRFYKNRLITSLCILLPLPIIGFIIFFCDPKDANTFLLSFVLLAIGIISTISDIIKLRALLSSPDSYDILNATATDAHTAFGMGRGCMYLDLEITTADGGTIQTESKGVFSRGVLSYAYYKNFINAHFRVLYDRTTSTVLVINK